MLTADCMLVQQYLCIGEAPDATQQAFQQRSRWSKGHFQVFWSRECPLTDRRLGIFFRLAYSSTCVAYLSTGLSVIVLNLVPVLTILFGYFPIALNLFTVIAITAYYGALNALSYACLSWGHYKARLRLRLHLALAAAAFW
jgi:endoglucanase